MVHSRSAGSIFQHIINLCFLKLTGYLPSSVRCALYRSNFVKSQFNAVLCNSYAIYMTISHGLKLGHASDEIMAMCLKLGGNLDLLPPVSCLLPVVSMFNLLKTLYPLLPICCLNVVYSVDLNVRV